MRIRFILLVCLLCALTGVATAQNIMDVTGVVRETDGNTVIGASVLVKGTSRGVVTDMDGRFHIKGVKSTDVLVISFVGMKTVEVKPRKQVTVTLESDNEMLDEVIVVAFGKQKKESFTGSAGVVKSEAIAARQVSNPISALNGKVAGVQMVEGNSPTSSPTIRVRGFSSLYAGNDPLIVLDGVPFSGSYSNINPSDVESVTVLKDAASNALYGARGANGVILITTKQAQRGKANISVDAKWGVNTDGVVEYDFIDNPGEYYEAYYLGLYNYYMRSEGLSAMSAHSMANKTMAGPVSDGGLGYMVYSVPDGQYVIGENGKLNPQATLGNVVTYNGQDYMLIPDDWKEHGLRNGLRQEYNVNVNGGSDQFQYYASLGYLKNEGLTYGSDYTRYSTRVKTDYQARPWFKLGTSFSYTHGETNSKADAFSVVHGIAPIYPLFIRDGQGNIMTDTNGPLYDYGDGENAGLLRNTQKSVNYIQNDLLDTSYNSSNAFNIQGYADITFLKDFKFTLNAGVSDTESRSTAATNPYYGYNTTQKGYVSTYHYRTYVFNTQQLLNWNKDINGHNVSVLLGHEYTRNSSTTLGASKTNMFSFKENQELSGAILNNSISGYSSVYNVEGWFLRGQYDYKEKYFASASIRRDGSSRFHPDHRWGNFWSLGGAWIIDKEDWFKADWVNMLKFKMSYGEQGNDGIGSYRYVDTYTIDNNNDEISLSPYVKGNQDITWETIGCFNTGLEFELFNRRLSGGVEYFYRKTSDMLYWFTVPSSLGYGGYYDNIGDMVNKGVELNIDAKILKTKKLDWSVNFNVTWYKNKVTYLADENKASEREGYSGFVSGSNFIAEGLPLYTFYLKKYAGVDPDSGLSMWYYNTTDENGNTTRGTTTVYSSADYYLCETAQPDFYGGFGTSFSYAGFDLNVNFLYSVGGKSYDSGYKSSMAAANVTYGGGGSIHRDAVKGWTEENRYTDIPRWQFNDTTMAYDSDRWLTDASSLTFKSITLGYTLPKQLTQKFQVNKLRVYVSCDNVAYWTKRDGMDPRNSFTGSVSSSSYSPMRTISGGINIQF
ncbi:MAG: TonB-dependent receptor [Bacteroides sp.]|nr:TonB-dependent receptor [Bacteroides sp.]